MPKKVLITEIISDILISLNFVQNSIRSKGHMDGSYIMVTHMNWRKRVYCGDLRVSHEGMEVHLMGWVDAIRDHGNVLFIHLRDVRGIVQVVLNPEINREDYSKAVLLKEEFVIEIRGKVHLREEGDRNPNLNTGEVEVSATGFQVLSKSKPLPFPISEKAMVFGEEIQSSPENVDEEIRLQYRYLDLRRHSVKDRFKKRYDILKTVREYLDQLHFIEVETPFLTKSTPEGARDYLVPSRVHQGKFYALPQSPQLFKQLLMMGGIDRYFQIARCFRDEDLRPNRQPEFTQLDLEASFIDEEFIYEKIEELTVQMFAVGEIQISTPFPRMTYEHAMERYGSDRPDLRFDMAFEEVTDIMKDASYSIFRKIIQNGGHIKGICVKGHGDSLSKNVLQNEFALKVVPAMGAKGLTWMKVAGGKLQSNIVQFFSESELEKLARRFKAEEGDVLLMIADPSRDLVNTVLGSLRLHVAKKLGMFSNDRFSPLWVTDFPLLEEKNGKLNSLHHPFTMPDRIDFDPMDWNDMLTLKSRSYDLVMNGEELGGGSIRIHDMEVQKKIFQVLGLTSEEAKVKFGFFLKALEYGAPPHAGLALGMDRVIAMILNVPSIRDVIAFPKNRSAYCPLTQSPSVVDRAQLEELGLGSNTSGETPSGMPDNIEGQKVGRSASENRKSISEKEIKHVAKLARLKLSDDEARLYQKDINEALEHFVTLQQLNTENVQPMSHVLETENVWREEDLGEPGEPAPLLNNAPMKKNDYFRVPKIL